MRKKLVLHPCPAGRLCLGALILITLLAPCLGTGEPVIPPQPSTAPAVKRWIVVTASDFRDAIAPLAKRRAQEGFDVVQVNASDVLTPEELATGDGTKLAEKVRQLWQGHPNSDVLLVGVPVAATTEDAQRTVVPLLKGTIGRMKAQWTDSGYGCRDGATMPQAAVGRFPARTVAEVKGMVAKTLAYEDDGKTAAWRRSITLLIGNPGGASRAEKMLGAWYIDMASATASDEVYPAWRLRCIFHVPTSPWYVPNDALHDRSLAFINQGQAFIFHLGHSSPQGFWSDDARFLDRDDWAHLNLPHGAGVLVTCGCWACAWDKNGRADHDGFGMAAMRNPAGPAAVIGSLGESYSVAGYLAFHGLLHAFKGPGLPEHLGELWLDTQAGLATGPVDLLTFKMFDYGDGSSGAIPLATQRQEHLQMWTLLGDPAMRLPAVTPEITLTAPASVKPGGKLRVSGTLPTGMENSPLLITLERPAGGAPLGLAPVPAKPGPDRDRVILANFNQAQNCVLQEFHAAPGAHFDAVLDVPKDLPWDTLVVRATAVGQRDALGVAVIKVQKPDTPQK